MCDPTGLGEFSRRFPERTFDVGIAEQHAVTSAAGLASGGLHPVVAVYATFLNRAFDQVLLDVALHRLPVTFVLDRAGITGEDGPSHNGVWDLAMLGVVPGIRIAAPRDESDAARAAARGGRHGSDGPTVVRFPKTPLGADLPAVAARTAASTCSPSPTPTRDVDVLVVADRRDRRRRARRLRVGASGRVTPCASSTPAGCSGRSRRSPTWPARAALVVTVEDGSVAGGVGTRIAQAITAAGVDHAGAPDRRADGIPGPRVGRRRASLGQG